MTDDWWPIWLMTDNWYDWWLMNVDDWWIILLILMLMLMLMHTLERTIVLHFWTLWFDNINIFCQIGGPPHGRHHASKLLWRTRKMTLKRNVFGDNLGAFCFRKICFENMFWRNTFVEDFFLLQFIWRVTANPRRTSGPNNFSLKRIYSALKKKKRYLHFFTGGQISHSNGLWLTFFHWRLFKSIENL